MVVGHRIFFARCYLFTHRRNPDRWVIIVIIINMYITLRSVYRYYSNKTITICTPFPNITNTKTYAKYNVVLKSLIYYIIPLCIIACFYVLMAIRLHASANEMPGEIRGTQSVAQARARRHVARMVLVFVFCKLKILCQYNLII